MTTLPLTLSAIINQTYKPSQIIIYDDNEPQDRIDLRNNQLYKGLFSIMDNLDIKWEVVFGECKGQHFGHQYFNNRFSGQFVYRCDDDCIPDPNVLENLWHHVMYHHDTGAVGGSIIVPTWNLPDFDRHIASNKIEDIFTAPNKQWWSIDDVEKVDHLHCSFLYRAGIANYNLSLSRVAHREETLFTYDLVKQGFTNYIIPNANTWHLKYNNGGIRTDNGDLFRHDETIFRKYLDLGYLVFLDNGIGDHLVFSTLLDEIIEKHGKVTLACCYPDVFQAWKDKVNITSLIDVQMLCDPLEYNIYKFMIDKKWSSSLQEAFRKLYLED